MIAIFEALITIWYFFWFKTTIFVLVASELKIYRKSCSHSVGAFE